MHGTGQSHSVDSINNNESKYLLDWIVILKCRFFLYALCWKHQLANNFFKKGGSFIYKCIKINCKFVKEENKWNKVKSLVMHFSVSK